MRAIVARNDRENSLERSRPGNVQSHDFCVACRAAKNGSDKRARMIKVGGIPCAAGDLLYAVDERNAAARWPASATGSAVMESLRGCLDRLDDFHIARASAKIPGQGVAYFVVRGRRISAQQRVRRHDHPRRAEPALGAELFVKGLLQPIEPALRGHAFDRFDVPVFATDRQRYAGWHRLAVDEDRTRAALAAVTAGLHAGKIGDVAQIVDK